MIDVLGFQSRQIGLTLKRVIERVSDIHGIIMFDLHPIRMGQPQYLQSLQQVLEHGTQLNGWFPTVTEAVEFWCKHRSWKHHASFCCLLTGDIDNIVFLDYLRRLF
jgi:hypothetical protein